MNQIKGPPATYIEIWSNSRNNTRSELDLEILEYKTNIHIIYWGQQFGFTKYNRGGYLGLQIVGSQKKAIFSIWDALRGISCNCVQIDEDGLAYRCLIDYEWEIGRKYRLNIFETGESQNGNISYIASVYDYLSKTETPIGTILIPNNRGKLKAFSKVFLEYAGYEEYDPKDIPFTKAIFSNPVTYCQGIPNHPKKVKISYGNKPNINSNVEIKDNFNYFIEGGDNVFRRKQEGIEKKYE